MSVSRRPAEGEPPAASAPSGSDPSPGSPQPFAAKRALAGLIGLLSADPVSIPALAAIAVLIAWAANEAGYPQTHWAPGGLILLALLAVGIGAAGLRRARTPRVVGLAIACLAAYTAFSFLSILWAKVPGDAWEGADRTMLYLIVFALFATWRRPGRSAALLLSVWVLALVGLAVFTVLHVDAAASSSAQLQALMPGGRLIFPAGYTNANAALWMMAFFPALILAASERTPWALRGLLAGGAVVLAGVALYSQSRGSVYSTPIVLALIFLLLPGRVRNFATLVPVGAGVLAAAPTVLRLDERVEAGGGAASAVHSATLAVLLAGLVVGLVVAVAAAMESRKPVSDAVGRRLHRVIATAGVLAVVALLAGGLVAIGNPVARAEREWSTFTSIRGYAANSSGESRLTGGLGSNRWDFYRVAWHEFLTHPVAGIGAENFAEPYLRLRRSPETPHYPHSVELMVMSQTGVIGALLAIAGLIAALVACRSALIGGDRLGRVVAAAAVAGFAYWGIHGSFDWFFEYAGLGAAAFMLLGLMCSVTPARAPARVSPDAEEAGIASSPGWRRRARLVAGAFAALALGLVAAASLALPWLSRLEVESAAKIWPAAPSSAYFRLREAASLNPLSDEPYVVAGTIALRLGELRRADGEFALALKRTPGDAYATLERGAIASTLGERRRALALLQHAAYLNPKDPLTKAALALARRGQRVNVTELNRSILRDAQQFS